MEECKIAALLRDCLFFRKLGDLNFFEVKNHEKFTSKENLRNIERGKPCVHFSVKQTNIINHSKFVRFLLLFKKIGQSVHVFLKLNQYFTYVVIKKV